MPILNYTTKIAPHRTVAEIQRTLSMRGAEAVTIEYGEFGRIDAVLFSIRIAGQRVNYRLPCKVDGVLTAMKRDRKVPRTLQNREHAESVAWRIVKDWCEAQLALVQAEQASLAEVFLPFAMAKNGVTVFQMFETQIARGLLTAGDSDGD